MRIRNIAFVLFVLFLAATLSAQMTVNIAASKDNTLYEDATGSLSNGAGDHFFAGKTSGALIRRGLIAFDLTNDIPPGATVTSVTITLHMSRTVAQTVSVELHKVLADWGEGSSHAGGEEGGGAPATTGDATWLHTFFNTDFWSNQGGDFSATVSDAHNVSGTGFYTWGSTPQMVADVQGWVDNPATNFGWILISDENMVPSTKRFDSRTNPTSANRPLLTVTYNPPVGIDDGNKPIVASFELEQNYPNPFNPETIIQYTLSSVQSLGNNSRVVLKIYDISGREVRTLVDTHQPAGTYTVKWDGTDNAGETVSSGVYLYRLQAGTVTLSRKMLLIR